MSRWLFASDLHGHAGFYAALERLCAEVRPAVVVLGGDLAPHGSGEAGIELQRLFFHGPFRDMARRLRRGAARTRLFVLPGNDDWRANMDILENEDGVLWHFLHARAQRVTDGRQALHLAGLSWVPVTPFLQKDWERWDSLDAPPGRRLEGFVSTSTGLEPVRLDRARAGETIEDALAELPRLSPPGSTVYCLHSPPHGTHCDLVLDGSHVGSPAIRRFIERHQPPLVLCGHIHEAPRVSGSYADRIGRTWIVNPGQFERQRFCAVSFDIRDVERTIRHTVRGALAAAPAVSGSREGEKARAEPRS